MNDKQVGVREHADLEKLSDDDNGVASKIRNSVSGRGDDAASIEGQLFSMNDIDPALDAKMRLVNNVSFLQLTTWEIY